MGLYRRDVIAESRYLMYCFFSIVYDPKAKDNEEKSGEKFLQFSHETTFDQVQYCSQGRARKSISLNFRLFFTELKLIPVDFVIIF